MQDRNVIVERESGGNGLGIAIVAIIAIAAIVAVLLWQPWNTTRSNTTIINPPSGSQSQTITQPGPGSAGGTSGGTSGSSGSGTSGGSSNGGYSR